MNDLVHPYQESLDLDKTITAFYDDLIDGTRSLQLKGSEVSKAVLRTLPIPFSQFVKLNRELNEHHDKLKATWNAVRNEVGAVIQQAWNNLDKENIPLNLQVSFQQTLLQCFKELQALRVDDRPLNPISAALSQEGEVVACIPAIHAPFDTNPFIALEDNLARLLKEIHRLEEGTAKKQSYTLSHNLELGLTSLRHCGILPRSFQKDMVPLIRLHIKTAYDELETLGEEVLWVNDVMNALTVQIIHWRDADIPEDKSESFYEFFQFIQRLTQAALHFNTHSSHEWMQLKESLRNEAHHLSISHEARCDIFLAIERLHTGGSRHKPKLEQTLTKFYETLINSGFLSPAYCEVWAVCRQKMMQAQHHLGRCIQKRLDDIQSVLMDITKVHETAFDLCLFAHLPKGSANTWLIEQQQALKNILLSTRIETFSHTTLETWEERYRQFWIQFSRQLDEKRITSNTFWGSRKEFDTIRQNLKSALTHLSDKGEMLFKFSEIHRDVLLSLLDEAWKSAYWMSMNERNHQREAEFEALKVKLKNANSNIEASHYLSQSMLIIQSHHAQTSLAHNIQVWQKPSRAAMALNFVREEAVRLNLLPSFKTLPFESVITRIQVEMDSYFSRFWFSNRNEQKEVHEVIQTVLIERGKLLNDASYTQEQAESAIMKRVHQQYLLAKEAHDNHPMVCLMRTVGFQCDSPYVTAWKFMGEKLKHEEKLNDFKQESEPAILIKLHTLLLQFKEKTRLFARFIGFDEDKQSAVELVEALIRVIKAKGYTKETVSFLFSKTQPTLAELRFKEFSHAFDEAYQNLKEREHLIDFDPKSDLEEAMEQDIEEVQDFYNKVRVFANTHQKTLHLKRS